MSHPTIQKNAVNFNRSPNGNGLRPPAYNYQLLILATHVTQHADLDLYSLKRPGRGFDDLGKVKMEFSETGECQLPDAFNRIKNTVPSRSNRILKSWKYRLLQYAREL